MIGVTGIKDTTRAINRWQKSIKGGAWAERGSRRRTKEPKRIWSPQTASIGLDLHKMCKKWMEAITDCPSIFLGQTERQSEEGIDHARTRLPPSPSRPLLPPRRLRKWVGGARVRSLFQNPELPSVPSFVRPWKKCGVGGGGVTLRSLAIFTSTFIQPQFKVSERGRKCQTHTNTLLARHSTFRFLHYYVKGCTNMFLWHNNFPPRQEKRDTSHPLRHDIFLISLAIQEERERNSTSYGSMPLPVQRASSWQRGRVGRHDDSTGWQNKTFFFIW